MEEQFTVNTPSEFSAVISAVLANTQQHQGALVIALKGDLGAGKTAFTQELGKVLGVTEHITSPTFTIMKQYEIVHPQFSKLIHIDAYRIEDETEVAPLKLLGLLQDPENIICIEWPEQIAASIPKDAIKIEIEITVDDKRSVRMYRPVAS